MKPIDLVVIGGGPAGSTIATLVKKYAPRRRVVLLEKHPGPRWHIGESLVTLMLPILKEMGVFEKIDAAGFPKKMGATYVFGRSRKPWTFDFNDPEIEAILREQGTRRDLEYAWQVPRAKYDHLLLEHAESAGVEVFRGAEALSVIETGGRVAGVRARLAAGEMKELPSEFVADCSGQDGFLSKYRKVRRSNPYLNNVAAIAYYKGAKWKDQYTGYPDRTKIFICSVDTGWFWYIPTAKDVVSVGFVTSAAFLKRSKITDFESHFLREVSRCDEIRPLLKNAERIMDVDGTGKGFFMLKDWSYLNVKSSGPGWVACGDAAVFVDPILSSGVGLAHAEAHRAAYTLLTHWRVNKASLRERMWSEYDGFCREIAGQFLALALFWYGNDRSSRRWWARAGEVQRARLPVKLSDRAAFITVASGLPLFYDRMYSSVRVLEPDLKPCEKPSALSLFGSELGISAKINEQIESLKITPRLACPYQILATFLPEAGKGVLAPVRKVRFLRHPTDESIGDALNPTTVVLSEHLQLLKAIDGKRTLQEIMRVLENLPGLRQWMRSAGLHFIKELYVQGVLDLDPVAGRRSRELAAAE